MLVEHVCIVKTLVCMNSLSLISKSLERYRLHSKVDEHEKNLVTKPAVVKSVLLQQTLQAIVSVILFKVSLSIPLYLVLSLMKVRNFKDLCFEFNHFVVWKLLNRDCR